MPRYLNSASLDFSHTCPRIDKAIKEVKSALHAQIIDLLSDACPLLPGEAMSRIAGERLDSFYESVEDLFESVRATNEEMRSAADHQISELTDRVHSLEQQVDALERAA